MGRRPVSLFLQIALGVLTLACVVSILTGTLRAGISPMPSSGRAAKQLLALGKALSSGTSTVLTHAEGRLGRVVAVHEEVVWGVDRGGPPSARPMATRAVARRRVVSRSGARTRCVAAGSMGLHGFSLVGDDRVTTRVPRTDDRVMTPISKVMVRTILLVFESARILADTGTQVSGGGPRGSRRPRAPIRAGRRCC